MYVISISLDTKMFEKNSKPLRRMVEYSSLFKQMHTICYTPAKNFQKISIGNLTVHPTNSYSKIFFIVDAFIIASGLLKKDLPTADRMAITAQDPFETGLVGLLLKKRFSIRLNIQDHGNFFESKYWRKESILNFFRYFLGIIVLKKSDSVRTVSLREKIFIEKNFGYPSKKTISYPIFTNWEAISKHIPSFDIKQRYPGFDFYILTVCRLEKVKNIPLLLESFSEILREFPKTLLLIIGSGSQEKNIRDMVQKRHLQNNVILENWTDDPASYYQTSDLFVLSSFSEGWGLTVIEAASSKCPVIMTDTGCANEFIINGRNGWIVPIQDKNALVESMQDAINNVEKRKLYAEQAFNDLSALPTKGQTLLLFEKLMELTSQK